MMNNRRRLNGVVIGTKMQKTVVVEITTRYQHPLYHKVVTSHNHVKAHDEMECSVGDEVRIVESKPISKTKRWVVEEITKRNELAESFPEA
ncbi:MAG TPA: 30S ribosomal protein S17 [Anaerolineales bacterium]|nr:30S ribosomal protein S17 [Anaerolineales bacterium]